MIINPVLPGFHPDPSILRVGPDFYLATSTFEWFPGVTLHHSKNLADWTCIGHALTRISQLDLTAVPDSGGVWAPSISFHQGKFWLVYTVMRTRTGPYKDLVNWLVTADTMHGPWSEPVYLNSRGFDPSLFHDDDGKTWIVQIQWDHRKDHPSFSGIVVQEWDPHLLRLLGEPVRIYEKSRLIEGPNLYKRNGFYYLLLAEGGTSWEHSVSMVRSRNLFGPYEPDPQEVILTSRNRPDLPLQKAGHGELVETASGEWFLAYLASRPLQTPLGPRCPLGRETCIQKVVWTEDGWLRLASGDTSPMLEFDSPQGTPCINALDQSMEAVFTPAGLSNEWMTLRVPLSPDWADLNARPGWLRLRGQESPTSLHHQSLVARRVAAFHFHTRVVLEFQPKTFAQMAGLICYYDTKTHYYLRVTRSTHGSRVLGIVTMQDGKYDELGDVEIHPEGEVSLGLEWHDSTLQFSFSDNGERWQSIGPTLDASVLSDDFGTGLHFTGAMVGLCVQDLDGHAAIADFTNFWLTPIPPELSNL